MNCPKCNASVAPDHRFCDNCGAQLDLIENRRSMAADDLKSSSSRGFGFYRPGAEALGNNGNAAPNKQPAGGYGYSDPNDQPAGGYGYSAPSEQPAGGYGYSAPNEQPAGGYGYSAPNEQPAVNNYGYSNPQRDFSSQYNDYQSPSSYSGGHGGYDYNNGGGRSGSKKVLIIVIIIVSVLVVAGAVVGIVLGTRSCSKSEDHSENQKVTTSDGTVIAEDDSIDVKDSDAQKKLEDYIEKSGVKALMKTALSRYSSVLKVDLTAEGNAIIYKVTILKDMTSSEKEQVKSFAENSFGNLNGSLSQLRSESGVSDAVVVVTVIDKDGTVYYNKTYK